MKKAAMWMGLILVNLFLAACALVQLSFDFLQANQKMPEGQHATISLTEADNGKEITVEDGAYIHITLPVDPTGGSEWVVKDAPGAARVVVRHGEPKSMPDDPSSPASGGLITYHFQALGLGADTLVMELRQGDAVTQTFTITIHSIYPK